MDHARNACVGGHPLAGGTRSRRAVHHGAFERGRTVALKGIADRAAKMVNKQSATVLDIGCNAGYYSIEMKLHGADRVVSVDSDEFY